MFHHKPSSELGVPPWLRKPPVCHLWVPGAQTFVSFFGGNMLCDKSAKVWVWMMNILTYVHSKTEALLCPSGKRTARDFATAKEPLFKPQWCLLRTIDFPSNNHFIKLSFPSFCWKIVHKIMAFTTSLLVKTCFWWQFPTEPWPCLAPPTHSKPATKTWRLEIGYLDFWHQFPTETHILW